MDAIELLKSDHIEIRAHMKRFLAAHEEDDAKAGEDEIRQLCDLLTVHSLLEENYFYPEVQSHKELIDDVQEGYEEHALADQLVEELQEIKGNDLELMAKGKVLCELVEHHMKEEEEELLPKAETALGKSRLEELGAQLEEVKSKMLASSSR